jgi:hypothetical protein
MKKYKSKSKSKQKNGIEASNYALKCKYCDNTEFSASPSGAIHCKSYDCIAVYAYGNIDGIADWHCINEQEIEQLIKLQNQMLDDVDM